VEEDVHNQHVNRHAEYRFKITWKSLRAGSTIALLITCNPRKALIISCFLAVTAVKDNKEGDTDES
jgi:hypothetical protein